MTSLDTHSHLYLCLVLDRRSPLGTPGLKLLQDCSICPYSTGIVDILDADEWSIPLTKTLWTALCCDYQIQMPQQNRWEKHARFMVVFTGWTMLFIFTSIGYWGACEFTFYHSFEEYRWAAICSYLPASINYDSIGIHYMLFSVCSSSKLLTRNAHI